jgi:hypothetical protein
VLAAVDCEARAGCAHDCQARFNDERTRWILRDLEQSFTAGQAQQPLLCAEAIAQFGVRTDADEAAVVERHAAPLARLRLDRRLPPHATRHRSGDEHESDRDSNAQRTHVPAAARSSRLLRLLARRQRDDVRHVVLVREEQLLLHRVQDGVEQEGV